MTIKVNQGPLPDKPLQRPIFGIWETEHDNGSISWRARIFNPQDDELWNATHCEFYPTAPWSGPALRHPWATIKRVIETYTPGTCVAWMYL